MQEMMPVVIEGEAHPAILQKICLGQLMSMTGLEHLRITRGAAGVFGDGMAFLSELRSLTGLQFSDDQSGPEGWSADNPEAWSLALHPLTGLQVRRYCPYHLLPCISRSRTKSTLGLHLVELHCLEVFPVSEEKSMPSDASTALDTSGYKLCLHPYDE